mgnify:CR=1 FL=1
MLKDKLKEDMKNALKAGDSARRTLLGMVLSSIKNKELEKRGKLIKTIIDPTQLEAESQLTEQETLDVVASEVKRRRDSVAEFTKGGRPELAASEQAEIDMLTPYLPEQMSDDALRAVIQKAITATGATTAKDIGKVMSAVKEETKGTADGQRISTIAKELLK